MSKLLLVSNSNHEFWALFNYRTPLLVIKDLITKSQTWSLDWPAAVLYKLWLQLSDLDFNIILGNIDPWHTVLGRQTAVYLLTHWGRVTHICVSKLTSIRSDNGLSPDRRQAIIWTNAGILLIGALGTNFNEISIEILTFSFKKMRLKVSSVKRRPFCLGLCVLKE